MMIGSDLKTARLDANWSQSETAQKLGVTQAYLSMLEGGARPIPADLATTALHTLPVRHIARPIRNLASLPDSEKSYKEALGELGYPGFAYLTTENLLNPAELFFLAVDAEDLDARVVAGLPWLPFHYAEMDWDWLITQSKLRHRQNRLAYITDLARILAQTDGRLPLAQQLNARIASLEPARLANEDTLCQATMTQAERRWLRSYRPPQAAHWNLLTDLVVEHLDHIG